MGYTGDLGHRAARGYTAPAAVYGADLQREPGGRELRPGGCAGRDSTLLPDSRLYLWARDSIR